MPAELGLAAFDASVTSAELLIWIVKTAARVVRLKKKCQEIKSCAEVLQTVLRDNEKALKDLRTTANLDAVLKELAAFVAHCVEKTNIIQRAWEVVWERRLPRLMEAMKDFIIYFVMESSSNMLSGQASLMASQNELLDKAGTISGTFARLVDDSGEDKRIREEQNNQMLDILTEMRNKISTRVGDSHIDFEEGDRRLDVARDEENNLAGTLEGRRVVCTPLSASQIGSRPGPRHHIIYAKISSNTLVHPFYGIARREHHEWAVMEDLRHGEPLALCMKDDDFKDVANKLSIIYDIANTVAYLHSLEILIKNLSDQEVVVVKKDGRWKPFLMNLEIARYFLEDTIGSQCDIRYEAPEYQSIHRHSVYTDIWSLGVLIWEWVTTIAPFGEDGPVLDPESPEGNRIRKQLKISGIAEMIVDSVSDSLIFKEIKALARKCCARDPLLRPSAAFVAHSIFMTLTSSATMTQFEIDFGEDLQQRVKDAIEETQRRTKMGITDAIPTISKDDAARLHAMAYHGDPVASALLGSCMWHCLLSIEDEDSAFASPEGADMLLEKRARASLHHLEFAAQAGLKHTFVDLYAVHAALANLYQRLRQQSKATHP